MAKSFRFVNHSWSGFPNPMLSRNRRASETAIAGNFLPVPQLLEFSVGAAAGLGEAVAGQPLVGEERPSQRIQIKYRDYLVGYSDANGIGSRHSREPGQ
jgi:hypothetical protein